MSKDELQALLDAKGVPKISYSLDGLKDGDCLCIVNAEGTWKLMHNSRGRISYSEECAGEEDAYENFWRIVKNSYGW